MSVVVVQAQAIIEKKKILSTSFIYTITFRIPATTAHKTAPATRTHLHSIYTYTHDTKGWKTNYT